MKNPATLSHREFNSVWLSVAGFFMSIVFLVVMAVERSRILFRADRQYVSCHWVLLKVVGCLSMGVSYHYLFRAIFLRTLNYTTTLCGC